MPVNVDEAERSFALKVHPLSTEGRDTNLTLLRVGADLSSSNGSPAISEVVNVDLLFDPDLSTHISQIRAKSVNRVCDSGFRSNQSWLTSFWLIVLFRDKRNLSSGVSVRMTTSNHKNGNDLHVFSSLIPKL